MRGTTPDGCGEAPEVFGPYTRKPSTSVVVLRLAPDPDRPGGPAPLPDRPDDFEPPD